MKLLKTSVSSLLGSLFGITLGAACLAETLEFHADEYPTLLGFQLFDNISNYQTTFCTPAFIQPGKGTRRRSCNSGEVTGIFLETLRRGQIVSISVYEDVSFDLILNLDQVQSCASEITETAAIIRCEEYNIIRSKLSYREDAFLFEICDPNYCATAP